MLRAFPVVVLLAISPGVAASAQNATPGQAPPARDTPGRGARRGRRQPEGLRAGSSRPTRAARFPRARVSLSSPQGGGRAVLTDNSGAFDLSGLPEGRFTLQVSKAGFIALRTASGVRFRRGTPIQLAAGQELKSVDFRLPRGGAVTGQVLDENSDPMSGVAVRVLEYRYAQGARTLVDAGNAQTDDRGEYRVWGLNPGNYYVSAQPPPGLPNGRRRTRRSPNGRGGQPPADDTPAFGYAPTYYPGALVRERRPAGHRRPERRGPRHFLQRLARPHGAHQRPRHERGRHDAVRTEC